MSVSVLYLRRLDRHRCSGPVRGHTRLGGMTPVSIAHQSPLFSFPSKRCTRCGEDRPVDQFGRNKANRDGLQSWCRKCSLDHHYKYQAAHPEKAREYAKRWKKKNPAAVRASGARARAAWTGRERAMAAGYAKAWKARNPDKNRAIRHARRARESSAPGSFSDTQLRARWDMWGGLCWMCGDIADSLDHVIALSRGGTNWPANLRPACRSCNSRKQDRDWREFVPAPRGSPVPAFPSTVFSIRLGD